MRQRRRVIVASSIQIFRAVVVSISTMVHSMIGTMISAVISAAVSTTPCQQLVIFGSLLGREDFLGLLDLVLELCAKFLVDRVHLGAIILLNLVELFFLIG